MQLPSISVAMPCGLRIRRMPSVSARATTRPIQSTTWQAVTYQAVTACSSGLMNDHSHGKTNAKAQPTAMPSAIRPTIIRHQSLSLKYISILQALDVIHGHGLRDGSHQTPRICCVCSDELSCARLTAPPELANSPWYFLAASTYAACASSALW